MRRRKSEVRIWESFLVFLASMFAIGDPLKRVWGDGPLHVIVAATVATLILQLLEWRRRRARAATIEKVFD